jgi:hypothetical protein
MTSKTTNKYASEVRGRAVRMVLEPMGNIPPANAEEHYYATIEQSVMAARPKPNGLWRTRSGSVSRASDHVSRVRLGARCYRNLSICRYSPGAQTRSENVG